MTPVPTMTVGLRGGAFQEKDVGAGQPFLWRERASECTCMIYLSKVRVKRHHGQRHHGHRATPTPEAPAVRPTH